MSGPYRRRLSRVERGYLNTEALGAKTNIRLVVEGEGSIDPGAFDAALAAAAKAAPGLSVTRRGSWWVGGGPAPRAEHLPARELNADHRFFQDRIDIVHGPVARLAVGHGEHSTVAVAVSHIVSDGRGIMGFLREVFAALRGEPCRGFPATIRDEEIARGVRGASEPAQVAPEPIERASPLRHLDGAQCRRDVWFQASCLPLSASAIGRVVGAIAPALPDGGLVAVPVDLRRHAHEVRSTANLTSLIYLPVTAQTTASAAQGALFMALLRRRELDPYRGDAIGGNAYARSLDQARGLARARGFPISAIVSDFGRFDEQAFSAPGFTARHVYTLPLVVPYAAMFVSVLTSTKETLFTLACRSDDDSDSALELLSEIVRGAPGAGEPRALNPSTRPNSAAVRSH